MTMMDALSTPRGPATDTGIGRAGTAGRGETQGEGGFSKVMSSTGQQGGQNGEPSDKQGMDDTVLEGGETGVDAKQSQTGAGEKATKPIIDISSALVRDVMGKHLGSKDAHASQAGLNDEKTGKANGKSDDPRGVRAKGELSAALEQAVDVLVDPAAGEIVDPDHELDAVPTGKGSGADDALQLLVASIGDGASAAPQGDGAGNRQAMGDTVSDRLLEAGHLTGQVSADADGGNQQASDRGSSDDKTFRFVRVDGKGEPLVLQAAEKAAAAADEGVQVETVTVVDSRRIIAPASTSNGANITAAMLGDSEWLSAMQPGSELANAATQSSQGRVVHTLKIQMTPIELGNVTATLKLVGEELSVQLTVDNQAALRQLQADQSDMINALKAQGLAVDQVQVTLQIAPGDKSAGSGQDGASGQQLGQQAQQSGSQSGNQERRSAPFSQMGQIDDRGAQELSVPSSDAARARPDQLYL
ncbi:flagellar hook-length control protein FliK [Peteryoungia ipomoeae]|uniref:Flagellar hook-length control protein FliK n=1 Tax=Peteryoungia ipomoeae TaxID=1210932 RepID=A0A4S8P779_9HYPH|nr:flagellar hook-length control protein FliK [Peteryoungia ipomoeae]THV23694.1 flagellar hook-length control protein FliK [Peteryoungia ipomoeae]